MTDRITNPKDSRIKGGALVDVESPSDRNPDEHTTYRRYVSSDGPWDMAEIAFRINSGASVYLVKEAPADPDAELIDRIADVISNISIGIDEIPAEVIRLVRDFDKDNL